ncbi:hypothetical protein [Kingella potus]|uniref:hypothetical protein n=1 Tax=Kingella potus TaxID=265175 RepID=UPI001FD3115B|nr:hypothetical protein [Kingella potus]UOP01231.1 hypothetical protein LVJ84_02820 [Kingella potus]
MLSDGLFSLLPTTEQTPAAACVAARHTLPFSRRICVGCVARRRRTRSPPQCRGRLKTPLQRS